MAKLIALTLVLTSLVAFATAHTTIITTTINDQYPQSQCRQQLQGQNLNQCRMYLQQAQSPYQSQKGQQQSVQQCCQQLQNIDQQCQCQAIKQVLQDVIQQQQHQIGHFGADQQTQQLKQQAEMIPNLCNLQSRQCQIGSVMTTTTIVRNSDIPFWPFGSQCSQSEIQKPVNQCQKYVEQQIWSPRSLLRMSISKKGQQDQSLQLCCNKLQNVKRDCRCEAIKEGLGKLSSNSSSKAAAAKVEVSSRMRLKWFGV